MSAGRAWSSSTSRPPTSATALAFQQLLADRWATPTAERKTRDVDQPGVRLRCYLDLRQPISPAAPDEALPLVSAPHHSDNRVPGRALHDRHHDVSDGGCAGVVGLRAGPPGIGGQLRADDGRECGGRSMGQRRPFFGQPYDERLRMPDRAGEPDHGCDDCLRLPELLLIKGRRPERLRHDPLNPGAFERLEPEQSLVQVRGRPHRHDRRTNVGEHVQEHLAALHIRTRPQIREARRRISHDVKRHVRRRVMQFLEPSCSPPDQAVSDLGPDAWQGRRRPATCGGKLSPGTSF